MKAPVEPLNLCSRGCGRKLASYNKSGFCSVCQNEPKYAHALRKDHAARELLAEVGPCKIEHGHHVNNLGTSRPPSAACALRNELGET